jgi:hypothetical protein
MRKTILLLAVLSSISTAACVHDDGRGTMSGGQAAIEVAPDVAKGAVTLAAVGLAIAFMYAQSR